jgi:uncharacterized BrkB/YihY/UPF0761 family membrane protein
MEMGNFTNNFDDNSVSSTTASNSDTEETIESSHLSQSLPSQTTTQITSNINSIGVQSSSEVHFGNRIVCKGPVTITQNNEEKNLKNIVEKRNFLRLNNFQLITLVTGIIVLFTIVIITIVINLHSADNKLSIKSKSDNLDLILRDKWEASPPAKSLNFLELPVDIVLYDYIDMPDCYTEVRGFLSEFYYF